MSWYCWFGISIDYMLIYSCLIAFFMLDSPSVFKLQTGVQMSPWGCILPWIAPGMGLVDLAVSDLQLESMVLKNFSNLNNSVTLWFLNLQKLWLFTVHQLHYGFHASPSSKTTGVLLSWDSDLSGKWLITGLLFSCCANGYGIWRLAVV